MARRILPPSDPPALLCLSRISLSESPHPKRPNDSVTGVARR
jgi:hypothetical protein